VRTALEDALHVSELRKVELQEKQNSERADLQSVKDELERQRSERLVLDDALRALEARLAKLAEEQKSERADREALNRELEGQRAARIALGRALRAEESRQRARPSFELATSVAQALAELVQPMADCGNLLLECLSENDPRRDRASRLVEIANHAGALARRLLNLPPLQEATDLNGIVAQMTEELQRQAGETIELLTIFSSHLPRILVAKPLVERLLAALVKHASDLLPLGGAVTLETRLSSPDETLETGASVVLSVTASGCSVQASPDPSALEPLVAACRGQLKITGDPDTGITTEVSLPSIPMSI
jgi:hypothetical protein